MPDKVFRPLAAPFHHPPGHPGKSVAITLRLMIANKHAYALYGADFRRLARRPKRLVRKTRPKKRDLSRGIDHCVEPGAARNDWSAKSAPAIVICREASTIAHFGCDAVSVRGPSTSAAKR